jgi:hypothetical protein
LEKQRAGLTLLSFLVDLRGMDSYPLKMKWGLSNPKKDFVTHSSTTLRILARNDSKSLIVADVN